MLNSLSKKWLIEKKKRNLDLTILQIVLVIPFILVSTKCQKKVSNPAFCDVWYD